MKLLEKKPAAETAVPTDAELVEAAFQNAPSRERLNRARSKKAQIETEYTAKTAECNDLRNRLFQVRSGRGIDRAVERILQVPAGEALFSNGRDLGLEEQITHADRERETLRRAKVAIEREEHDASVEVGREISAACRQRQNEFVQEVVAAGRKFVDTMRRERALRAAVESCTNYRGGNILPVVTFFGMLTAEDNYDAFERWLAGLRRDGFTV